MDRAAGLPRRVRVLVEDFWRRVWARGRLRDRHGVPVRHQLERALPDVRTNPGSASHLRDLHRFCFRGKLFRHPAVRPLSRPAMVLFAVDRHGGARDHTLGFLDHGQQQLDAGAGRLCDGKRRLCSSRLVQDHLQPRGLGALPPHAPGLVPDRSCSALRPLERGICCAAPITTRLGSCSRWVFIWRRY